MLTIACFSISILSVVWSENFKNIDEKPDELNLMVWYSCGKVLWSVGNIWIFFGVFISRKENIAINHTNQLQNYFVDMTLAVIVSYVLYMLIDFPTVRGRLFPKAFNTAFIEYVMDYQPGPADRLLLTYPKCGTWWTLYILLSVVNAGSIPKSTPDYANYTLELKGPESVDRENEGHVDREVKIIQSHMWFKKLTFHSTAKYLVVLRNPKDRYFRWYMSGGYQCGDYFEATLSYWEHRLDGNCTLITYEEMVANPRDSIVRIASFLGTKYVHRLYDRCGDTTTDEILLDRIIRTSSFEAMKSSQTT
ncbi:unnamed protein product, partial [Oppiella nova]